MLLSDALVVETEEALFEDDLEGVFWDERGFASLVVRTASSEDERRPDDGDADHLRQVRIS
jgi:hypothetical protein